MKFQILKGFDGLGVNPMPKNRITHRMDDIE